MPIKEPHPQWCVTCVGAIQRHLDAFTTDIESQSNVIGGALEDNTAEAITSVMPDFML